MSASEARTNRENARLRADLKTITNALLMVLSNTLLEADGHDWRICDQPSCILARTALKKIKLEGPKMPLEEIKRRIELASRRIAELKFRKDRASILELDMHEHDLKLLMEMLKKWKP